MRKTLTTLATIVLGGMIMLLIQDVHAKGPISSGMSKLFLSGDYIFQRPGDMKVTVHSDTDTPTADALLLEAKTGATTPTTKFSVDEDGDVYVAGTLGTNNTVSSGTNFRGATGAASTPTYSFTSDPNTGMYWSAADQLGIATGGTERIRVAANGNVGIGSTTPSQSLDVVGTTETDGLSINGDPLDATPTEIDQALDGISANVTSSNLSTVTGGGNADSLHSHSGGSTGEAQTQQSWYETDFNGGDVSTSSVVAGGGSIGFESSAPGNYFSIGGSTHISPSIANGGFMSQTVTASDMSNGTVSKVYVYRDSADGEPIHAEIWDGAGSAQLGSDSNTDTDASVGGVYLTFPADVDVSGETTFEVRIYNTGTAATLIYVYDVGSYAGGQCSTAADDDMYILLWHGSPTQLTGTAFVRPDDATGELLSSWESVEFGITTPGSSTITVDLIDTSDDSLIAGYADISSGTDISSISTGVNVGFKISFTRTTTSEFPTLDFLARVHQEEAFADASRSDSEWTLIGYLNSTTVATGYTGDDFTLEGGYEYMIVATYSTSERIIDSSSEYSFAETRNLEGVIYNYDGTSSRTREQAHPTLHVAAPAGWTVGKVYGSGETSYFSSCVISVSGHFDSPSTATLVSQQFKISSATVVGNILIQRNGLVRLYDYYSSYDVGLAIFVKD